MSILLNGDLCTDNGTGASPGWNWMLSFFFSSSSFVGFDGAGHVSEETKDAKYVSLLMKVKERPSNDYLYSQECCSQQYLH